MHLSTLLTCCISLTTRLCSQLLLTCKGVPRARIFWASTTAVLLCWVAMTKVCSVSARVWEASPR